MKNTLREQVLLVFQDCNPAKARCMSVYEPVVTDLLTYWSYSDSIEDIRLCIMYLLSHHFNRNIIIVSTEMVLELHEIKKNIY